MDFQQFREACLRNFDKEWIVIRGAPGITILFVVLSFTGGYAISQIRDQMKNETVELKEQKVEKDIKKGTLRHQAYYLAGRLNEMLEQIQFQPNGGIPTASGVTVLKDFQGVNEQVFNKDYREKCKMIRKEMLEQLSPIPSNDHVSKYYEAQFSLPMLVAIRNDLLSLADKMPVTSQ